MSVRSSGDGCRTPSTTPTFLCTISAALSFVTNYCWFSRYLSLAEVSYSPKEMHSELDLLLDLSCKKVFGLPPPFCAAQWGRDEIQLSSELSWTRLETFPAQLLPGTGQIGAFRQQRAQLCRWSQAFRVHVSLLVGLLRHVHCCALFYLWDGRSPWSEVPPHWTVHHISNKNSLFMC